jgi:signal transduction histidine kinase
VDELEEPVNNDIQTAFYRMLQEQFKNILKYAKASSVLISIKADDNSIHLSIKDDGGVRYRHKKSRYRA